MAFGNWMKVLDTVAGLAQMAGRMRGGGSAMEPAAPGAGGGAIGQLETRLAGVVVAALKEAFDRDRARMDLERAHMDAERQRAEEALRAELRRQAADRALGQLRLISVMAIGTWVLSIALAVWLPGMRDAVSRVLIGLAWVSAIGALGCSFAGWQHVAVWSADPGGGPSSRPQHPAAAAAPWCLLAALVLTCVSVLTGF
jgi:hypothetical protein